MVCPDVRSEREEEREKTYEMTKRGLNYKSFRTSISTARLQQSYKKKQLWQQMIPSLVEMGITLVHNEKRK